MTKIIQIKNLSMEIAEDEPGVFFTFSDPKNEDDLSKSQFEYMQKFVVKCLY